MERKDNRYFKRGYACQLCVDKGGDIPRNRTAVYFREEGKFVFANLVKCPRHGITPSVKFMDVARRTQILLRGYENGYTKMEV